MDKPEPVYYQPPNNHQTHLKGMFVWLTAILSLAFIAVILAIIFARELAQLIPFSAEQRFVKPYETLAERFWDGEPGDPTVEAYLQQLADELAFAMALPDDFEITVHYIDSPIENAFATLGGHLFLYRGMLESIDNENELSMVIAHELAHVRNRDPVVALGRGVALQLIYAFISGDYGSADTLYSLGGELGLLFFSREQEQQADLDAVDTLNAHYGHVTGHSGFFEKLLHIQSETEVEFPEWLATHPDLANRIAAIQQHVDAANYARGDATPLPASIIEALATSTIDVED